MMSTVVKVMNGSRELTDDIGSVSIQCRGSKKYEGRRNSDRHPILYDTLTFQVEDATICLSKTEADVKNEEMFAAL